MVIVADDTNPAAATEEEGEEQYVTCDVSGGRPWAHGQEVADGCAWTLKGRTIEMAVDMAARTVTLNGRARLRIDQNGLKGQK